MAAFALQPHVADFLDVVMHDEAVESRMEQVRYAPGVAACWMLPAAGGAGETTGVLLLAVRSSVTGVSSPTPVRRRCSSRRPFSSAARRAGPVGNGVVLPRRSTRSPLSDPDACSPRR